jgi:hypothetical protein
MITAWPSMATTPNSVAIFGRITFTTVESRMVMNSAQT